MTDANPTASGPPPAADQTASLAGARRIVNLVNLSTPLGLLVARIGGARTTPGPRGLIMAEGYRWRFPVASAFTVGNVLITGRGWDQLLAVNPRLRDHEERHSTQWALFGPAFLPAYTLAFAWSLARAGDRWSRNVFERAAGLSDGGYPVRPDPG